MNDVAHEWTDKQLETLERSIASEYRKAVKELKQKQADLMQGYEVGLSDKKRLLSLGEISKQEYDEWLSSQALHSSWLNDMVNNCSRIANNTNKAAIDMINGSMASFYAENYNWGTYQIENGTKINTGFNLVDVDTVMGMLADNPNLLPQYKLDSLKDIRWNNQKFNSAILQGILQGESITNIAKRLQSVVQMNHNSAVRNARTATTAAENKGRVDSYKRAERMGIEVKKEWLATLDGRTRHSHRRLDGVAIDTDEKFDNGCRFPGDPSGPSWEVYNCRCTLIANLPEVDTSGAPRNSKLGSMSYDEWKNEKAKIPTSKGTVDGKDIVGEWKRRPDQFDFEIEDVMNAQGFDGLPRVVDADEFDRAVKAANNGDGLIMQRTYSAPDSEVLKAYRDQLYNGKWYVDCSTGGAQYGQGMYAAADYTGKLSQGIKAEMQHYIDLNVERTAEEAFRRTLDNWSMADIKGLKITQEQFDAWKTVQKHGGLMNLPDSERWAYNISSSIPSKQTDKLWKYFDKEEAKFKRSYAGNSYIETMTLDPSAKIITFWDAETLQYQMIKKYAAQGLSREEINKIVPENLGSFAAAMGYDAINAEDHGKSGSYTVVLNRTKLIIRRP